jgi:hypothetical protein
LTGQRLEKPQEGTFEGFSVFNIEGGFITKDFDIDHSYDIPYNNSGCGHWYEWLPERSFVVRGKVITMKKYSVIGTNLTTGETLWNVPIDKALLGCSV